MQLPILVGLYLAEVMRIVGRAAERALAMPEAQKWNRRGGFFVLVDRATGFVLMKAMVGEVSPERVAEYEERAEERARRLFETQARCVSSMETRDTGKKRHGGAILGERFIFSFYGFPELVDEAVSIAAAMALKDLGLEGALAIVQRSANMRLFEYFLDMRYEVPPVEEVPRPVLVRTAGGR